jgi:hypothetical protein
VLTFIALAVGLILLIMLAGVVINLAAGVVVILTLALRFPIPALMIGGLIGYDAYARAHGMPTMVDVIASATGR